MKALITGATGFVGSYIAKQLAAAGHDVRVLLRSTSDTRFLDGVTFEACQGDIGDPSSLNEAVRGADLVIHSAGLVRARTESEFYAVNALGTANLLAAISTHAPNLKRFVYLSSLAAHGPSNSREPRLLSADPAPITPYGRTKAQGEEMVRKWPLANRSAVLRLPVVYGPKDLALLPFFQLAKWRLAPLLWGGRNIISIIYAEDAANAAVSLATTTADVGGKSYTSDDGYHYSWRELYRFVQLAVGHRAFLIPMPLWSYYLAAAVSEGFGWLVGKTVPLSRDKVTEMQQSHWVSSNQAIETDLGWRPKVTFQEGALLTADWYRQQMML